MKAALLPPDLMLPCQTEEEHGMSVCNLPVSSEHPLSPPRPCFATSMCLMPEGFRSPRNFDLLRVEKEELKSLPNDKLPSAHYNVHNPPCLCREQKTQQLNKEETEEEVGRAERRSGQGGGTHAARIEVGFCQSKGSLKCMQCSFD